MVSQPKPEDEKNRRGRAYQCLKCGYTGNREQAGSHVVKSHFQADEVPFTCTLCLYRCETRRLVGRHAKGYAPHLQKVDALKLLGGEVGSEQFIKTGSEAKTVQEGII